MISLPRLKKRPGISDLTGRNALGVSIASPEMIHQAERSTRIMRERNGGGAIAVPSDPGVVYHLVSWQKLPNGNLEAVTRRKGSSGTSFARREISCEAMTFRYLGKGDPLHHVQTRSEVLAVREEGGDSYRAAAAVADSSTTNCG